MTRTDMGGDWWSLAGYPVSLAYQGKTKASPPSLNPHAHTCSHYFICTREPAAAPGKVAAGPDGKCDAEARPATMRDGQVYVAFSPGLTAFERKVEPAACCYAWNQMDCGRGRTLRDAADRAIVAEVVPRDGWSTRDEDGSIAALDVDARRALAAHWGREGAMEHASIASFSIAALELLSLGAPAALIAAAHGAALDEIDHARRAFALATRYGGAPVGPIGLDVARHAIASDVASIARKTLRDACVDETIAALSASAAAARAVDARVVEALEVIAADEARHAELGWKTLAWLCTTFGEEARRVLRDDVATLRSLAAIDAGARVTADAASTSHRATLGDHGALDEATLVATRADAMTKVVLPCLEALVDGGVDDAQSPRLEA